jgi:DNA polymerase I-like protein with 3'-5' exonuclease and polymerase domains
MVFGAMYDRSPAAMVVGPEMDYLVNELGGEPWDLPRMEEFFSKFFGEFHELKKWQIAQKKDIYKTQVLETEMGRLRRFPFIRANDHGAAGRQAINTPIQSLASDFNLDAMVRIHNRIDKMNRKAGKVLAHVVLIIHDSVAVEAHKSVKERVKRIIQEEMENPPIKTKVPFKVNISEAANWGETH